jgi:aminomethyltransferase
MADDTKRTPLHGWHVGRAANMSCFGGYDMPLWYSTGAKEEHLAVIQKAGVFDTSHMAAVHVAGPGARYLLQHCFTKDVEACVGKSRTPLVPGKSVYGAYLNERGEVLDDSILAQIAADEYLVVVNAGMGGAIARHLQANAGVEMAGVDKVDRVDVVDLTDRLGKIDLQGPLAGKIVAKILAEPGKVLDGLPYFSFKGHFSSESPLSEEVRLSDGTPILLSRTGYTGEFGFEMFMPADRLVAAWEMLLAAGEPFGLIPCGLAARDSLRAGAVLPLSHQDIGAWPFVNHPWPFALPYAADGNSFTKDFIGRAALEKVRDSADHTYPFAGYDLRKVSAEEGATVCDEQGAEIGKVLSCVTDMAIGRHEGRICGIAGPDKPEGFAPRGLCCGFIKVRGTLRPGQNVEIRDSRRKVRVEVVEDVRPHRTARCSLKNML